jgi:hypothetical protein
MRNRALPLSLVFTALFLVSCDRPAIEPSQSLVGAKRSRSVADLTGPMIFPRFQLVLLPKVRSRVSKMIASASLSFLIRPVAAPVQPSKREL